MTTQLIGFRPPHGRPRLPSYLSVQRLPLPSRTPGDRTKTLPVCVSHQRFKTLTSPKGSKVHSMPRLAGYGGLHPWTERDLRLNLWSAFQEQLPPRDSELVPPFSGCSGSVARGAFQGLSISTSGSCSQAGNLTQEDLCLETPATTRILNPTPAPVPTGTACLQSQYCHTVQ